MQVSLRIPKNEYELHGEMVLIHINLHHIRWGGGLWSLKIARNKLRVIYISAEKRAHKSIKTISNRTEEEANSECL